MTAPSMPAASEAKAEKLITCAESPFLRFVVPHLSYKRSTPAVSAADSMTPDERAIRELVATWMKASQAGDLETVLGHAN